MRNSQQRQSEQLSSTPKTCRSHVCSRGDGGVLQPLRGPGGNRRSVISSLILLLSGCGFFLTVHQPTVAQRVGASRKGTPFTPAVDLNPEHIAETGPTHLQAEDVAIQVIDNVRISVRSMDGLLLPTHPQQPISLDVPDSLRVQILSARTSLTAEALTNLLNDYTLPHAQSSVHDLKLNFIDGRVHVEGKLKKLIDIPFSAEGSVDITPSGDVRAHFSNFTAVGFVHKGLLDWLGIHVDSVAKPGRSHSFQVVDNDVIFPMHTLFPAPHFVGRLRAAKIEGDEFVQVFGEPKPFAPAPVPAARYIYFRGGVMRCGRMTMQGVDLELLNKDEGKPLTFSIEHNFAQTLPGYLKNTPTHGLVAYIASYTDIARSEQTTSAVPED